MRAGGRLLGWAGTVVLFAIPSAACRRPPAARSAAAPVQPLSPETRDDIAEAVLRLQLRFLKEVPGFSSYCVGVLGKDADAALLHRFECVERRVRPISACPKNGRMGQRIDPSGEPAADFGVDRIELVADGEAVVVASWSPGHSIAGGTSDEYRVKRIKGQWSVADARLLAIE